MGAHSGVTQPCRCEIYTQHASAAVSSHAHTQPSPVLPLIAAAYGVVRQAWVSKKVAELLGAEEPSLVKFIGSKLNAHASCEALVTELAPVLDDDNDKQAEKFVLKLQRLLILETKKAVPLQPPSTV
jgi:hypothetical protein